MKTNYVPRFSICLCFAFIVLRGIHFSYPASKLPPACFPLVDFGLDHCVHQQVTDTIHSCILVNQIFAKSKAGALLQLGWGAQLRRTDVQSLSSDIIQQYMMVSRIVV
jgi:hypothetical protein